MKTTASNAHSSQNSLVWSGNPHLINSKDLNKNDVLYLLRRAKFFKEQLLKIECGKIGRNEFTESVGTILAGRVAANLFYENSTRTRLSFELASKHLGMHVLNLDISKSSVQKGESLEDTGKTLAAMGVNVIVQRHSISGSCEKIAEATNHRVHVINAGEGTTEHPTQALLDLFTMLEVNPDEPELTGKKIVIVGDILHSRVASSNLILLPMFGAHICLVGPQHLLPKIANNNVEIHTNMDKAMVDADFVISVRPQFERQKEDTFGCVEEYINSYQINHERLKSAKKNVKVCAPGPINRDMEISNDVANDISLSLIERQVQNGVVIRMAVIETLCTAVKRK